MPGLRVPPGDGIEASTLDQSGAFMELMRFAAARGRRLGLPGHGPGDDDDDPAPPIGDPPDDDWDEDDWDDDGGDDEDDDDDEDAIQL
ncbi:MAG: hypothetical protein WCB48_04145 [Casimicrobiaceae bacterium]